MSLRKIGASALTLMATAAVCMTASTSAAAQSSSAETAEKRGIEEIVVTAQKRDENLQDVPLPITAFSEEYLEDLLVKNLQELTDFTPSMNFITISTVRGSYLSVRGIGSSGQNAGIDGSVGLYLDGVYIPRQAGLLNRLGDIQTVELLRGPQGTLYGANTPAGLLAVNTRKPTDAFEAKLTAGIGNGGFYEVSGFVSGALSDAVNGRLTFWKAELDGLTDMVLGGETNGYEDQGFRTRIDWQVSSNFSLEVIADYMEYDGQCCDGEWIDISDEALATFDRLASNIGVDRDTYFPSRTGDGYLGRGEELDHKTFADGDNDESFEHWGVSVRGTWDITSGALADHSLEIVTSYRDWDSNQATDSSNMGVDFTIFAEQPEIQESMDFEVRLASPDDGRYQYLVGLYGHFRDSDFTQQTQLLAPGCLYSRQTEGLVARGLIPDAARSLCAGWWRNDNWTQETDSYAAFGQLTFNVSEQFDVIAGARVTRDEKVANKTVMNFGPDTPQNGLGAAFASEGFTDEKVDNTQTTWALTGRYRSEDGGWMAFARVATGYKAPGINARPIRFPTIPRNFGPEESINYEVGFKSTWLENRLLLNLTVFHSEYEELQQIVSNPALDPTGAQGTFVQNAGELEHKGVEIEYEYIPVDWLRIFGSAAYLDSEFKEFVGTPCAQISDVPSLPPPFSPLLCDQTGFRNQYTPEWRMNHTVEFSQPIVDSRYELFARVSGVFTDDLYTASDRDERSFQDSYWIWNASAGITDASGKWQVMVWGKNLDDEEYKRFTGNPPVAGNLGTRGSKIVTLGSPRAYGIEFTMNFD